MFESWQNSRETGDCDSKEAFAKLPTELMLSTTSEKPLTVASLSSCGRDAILLKRFTPGPRLVE